jgi:hypothetical protein
MAKRKIQTPWHVLYWLRDTGAEFRRMQAAGRPFTPQPKPGTDEAVVEFFEDVGDALSDAITAAVDVVVGATTSLAEAIIDVVNWVEEVQDLVYALLVAGKTVIEIVEAASSWVTSW